VSTKSLAVAPQTYPRALAMMAITASTVAADSALPCEMFKATTIATTIAVIGTKTMIRNLRPKTIPITAHKVAEVNMICNARGSD
jgi:hypothetical protein